MAHVWMRSVDGDWVAHALSSHSLFLIRTGCDAPVGVQSAAALSDDGVLLSAFGSTLSDWGLFAGNGHVSVNGEHVVGGFRVMRNQDEVRLGADVRFFFATDMPASITNFVQEPGPLLFCVRCKQAFADGDAIVRCPNPACAAIHHQSEQYPCWMYADTCAMCDEATGLDDGFRWSPEAL